MMIWAKPRTFLSFRPKFILHNQALVRTITTWVDQPSLTDPSQEYLSKLHSPIKSIFDPNNVALIGATDRENAVGRTIFENLLDGLKKNGRFGVFPVNSKRDSILGHKCYRSILDIPSEIDLAIIATPAKTVPHVMREIVEKDVSTSIVISAGFKELGEDGIKAEQDLLGISRQNGCRIIGPNCLGVMNPITGLNASFASSLPLPGNLAFLSQSGAMCTSVLDWSHSQNIGFSAFVSVGSMSDVNWGDLIDYFGKDVNTHSILIYMETIGDARAFLSAAKEVAMVKPIIVIKAGKSDEAAKAAASHTGSMAGAYDAFEAAMRRVGVLTVDTISELFNCAMVLSKQPTPRGPNLSIITNAGGPAVLATDALVSSGGKLTQLEDKVISSLNKVLPEAWSHGNPVDVLGDAGPQAYKEALSSVMESDRTDGVLVILTPQATTDCTATANHIVEFVNESKKQDKLILGSWMGGSAVEKGKRLLIDSNIPCFDYPDEAASTFSKIWQRTRQLEMIYEVPDINVSPYMKNELKEKALSYLKKLRNEGRTILTESEAKEVLAIYNLPTDPFKICESAGKAADEAKKMGFPVAVKLNSHTITHKKDVGGVQLNLSTPNDVMNAFNNIKSSVSKLYGEHHFQGVSVQPMVDRDECIELLLGSYTDPQFGPLVMFGSGGTFVEIFKDRSLAIPPFNSTLAKLLIEDTKIYKALVGGKSLRFKGVDIEELEKTIIRFAQMVVDLREYIAECDINPLLVSPHKAVCIDSRISLHTNTHTQTPLAVRPYPTEYILKTLARNGENIIIRPLYANDENLMKHFHRNLSSESIKQRYLADVSLEDRVARQYLISVCNADYNKLIPLAAINSNGEIIGVGRFSRIPTHTQHAELKLVIRDDYQKLGIGSKLLDHIIDISKSENINKLMALVLEENSGMLKMLKHRNFQLTHNKKNPSFIEANLFI